MDIELSTVADVERYPAEKPGARTFTVGDRVIVRQSNGYDDLIGPASGDRHLMAGYYGHVVRVTPVQGAVISRSQAVRVHLVGSTHGDTYYTEHQGQQGVCDGGWIFYNWELDHAD